MADQEGEQKSDVRKVVTTFPVSALNEVAETQAGVTLLTWLKNRCFFQTSTIVGSPTTHEINIYGTLFNEAERRLYLDIRRHLRTDLRKKIEQ